MYFPQVFLLNLRVFVCACITGVGLARWLCGGAFIEVGPREHSSPPGFADRKPPSQPPTCCMLSLCLPLSLSACVSAFAGLSACVFVCVFVYAYIWVRLPQASEPALNMLHAPLSLCVSMCLFPRFCVCWWFCVCRGICVCICACVFVYLRGFADRWSAKNMLHARSLNTARCFAFPFPRHIFPNIPQPEIEDLPEPPEPLSPKLTDPNASTAWLSKSLS